MTAPLVDKCNNYCANIEQPKDGTPKNGPKRAKRGGSPNGWTLDAGERAFFEIFCAVEKTIIAIFLYVPCFFSPTKILLSRPPGFSQVVGLVCVSRK